MKDISILGLGTAAIGRPEYINIRQEPTEKCSLSNFEKEGLALLQFAFDKGIRYFDTAPGYGMAEQMMIKWLKDIEPNTLQIASKWGYTYTADFKTNAKIHEVKEHSIAKLNSQWNVSTALLPALKFYQIHSATFETQVLDNDSVLNRLSELKDKYGLVIGITTTGYNQVEVFEKAITIEKNGNRLFDLFQITYNIFDQSFGSILHNNNDPKLKIVVKEALANGRLFPNNQFKHYQNTYKCLNRLSKIYNVGVDAIALRFCIDSIPAFKVLSGASKTEHLISNLAAINFELKTDEIEELKSHAVNAKLYWTERKQLKWN